MRGMCGTPTEDVKGLHQMVSSPSHGHTELFFNQGEVMKVEWEEKDVWAGRRFHKPGTQEEWMIGYMASESRETGVTMISLIDGMVQPHRTRTEMAAHLNEGGYVPIELLRKRE